MTHHNRPAREVDFGRMLDVLRPLADQGSRVWRHALALHGCPAKAKVDLRQRAKVSAEVGAELALGRPAGCLGVCELEEEERPTSHPSVLCSERLRGEVRIPGWSVDRERVLAVETARFYGMLVVALECRECAFVWMLDMIEACAPGAPDWCCQQDGPPRDV